MDWVYEVCWMVTKSDILLQIYVIFLQYLTVCLSSSLSDDVLRSIGKIYSLSLCTKSSGPQLRSA
jgi:hypothetical protein